MYKIQNICYGREFHSENKYNFLDDDAMSEHSLHVYYFLHQ